MKKKLLIAGILVLLFACSSEKVNFSQLQDRNGIYYLINKDKPFTGDVIQYNNGKVEMEGRIDNGLRVGLWVSYYPSGQKKMEGNFKEGVKDGSWTYWNDNGQQQAQEMYKYGKLLSNEGTLADTLKNDTVTPAAVTDEKAVGAPKPSKVEKKHLPVVYERLRGGPIKYLDGLPYTGPVVKYQKNGEKELDGYFTGGRRTGKWIFYDRIGNIRDVKYY
jgi:antitoxin component YwqK of YwqJK toxin-antitoxin module